MSDVLSKLELIKAVLYANCKGPNAHYLNTEMHYIYTAPKQ